MMMGRDQDSLSDRAATAMEHAAEMLETGELGWIQNQFQRYTYAPGGAINSVTDACLVGSVDYAINKLYGGLWYTHLHPLTSLALMKVTGSWAIARWNDDLERTKAQVVDALKTAAKDLRNSADPS